MAILVYLFEGVYRRNGAFLGWFECFIWCVEMGGRFDPDRQKLLRTCLDQTKPLQKKMHPKMRYGVDMKLDIGAAQELGYQEEHQYRREDIARCEKQCSQILPHLFFGGNAVAQNLETLQNSRITHILNCVGFLCPEYFPESFVYKTLWLQDNPSEDLVCILYDVFDYFEDVLENGGRVFVHCIQGVSRSASLVIAYLMWREKNTFEEAFEKVKKLRCVASPNMGFVFQLLQWQSRILNSPDNPSSPRCFRMAPFSAFDPLHLVLKAVSNPNLGALDSRGCFVLQLPSGLYVWHGKHSASVMAVATDHAAFQLVRYERAQGPILSVWEGGEPHEILKFLSGCVNDVENSLNLEKWQEQRVSEEQEVFNPAYTPDFEIFRQAQLGVFDPPLLGGLPFRNGNWGLPHSNSKKRPEI